MSTFFLYINFVERSEKLKRIIKRNIPIPHNSHNHGIEQFFNFFSALKQQFKKKMNQSQLSPLFGYNSSIINSSTSIDDMFDFFFSESSFDYEELLQYEGEEEEEEGEEGGGGGSEEGKKGKKGRKDEEDYLNRNKNDDKLNRTEVEKNERRFVSLYLLLFSSFSLLISFFLTFLNLF